MRNKIDQSEKVLWIECWVKEHSENLQKIFSYLDEKSSLGHKHSYEDLSDLQLIKGHNSGEKNNAPTRLAALSLFLHDYFSDMHDGAKGEQGDRGVNGSQGERGPQGQQGERGKDGLQGVRGETGQQGIQGLQGPVGYRGEKGEKGDPATGSMIYKGAWKRSGYYYVFDVVIFQKGLYICTKKNDGFSPENKSYWDILAEQQKESIQKTIEREFAVPIAGPQGPAGASLTENRGTFENADLVAGKLTITHNKNLSAPYSAFIMIFNNSGRQILPDEITGSANAAEIDLSSYGLITGTWGYIYV
jgi:hypothetical protein